MPAGRGTCLPTASNSCKHKPGRQSGGWDTFTQDETNIALNDTWCRRDSICQLWHHSFTKFILGFQVCTGNMAVTSYLIETTRGQVGVTVALCTNVRSRQTVALPIYLLTKAQRAHLERSINQKESKSRPQICRLVSSFSGGNCWFFFTVCHELWIV